MDSVKDAERCIKYLNHSVLEGRYITVERTEIAVAVEGGTTIVMILDTVGHHQDATYHLVIMEGGHLVIMEEALEEIGLTLLVEEAQREGPREGINLVARDDLFKGTRSPAPRKKQLRSLIISTFRSKSRSIPRNRSRSRRPLPRPISPSTRHGRSEIENPGNTLYVTGLSTKVTDKDLEAHFSKQGNVASCVLMLDPHTRESRGYAFVTMDSLRDAALNGRYIKVEKVTKNSCSTASGADAISIEYIGNIDCSSVQPRIHSVAFRNLRHNSPRDERKSPRRDHSPGGGRSPEKRYHQSRAHDLLLPEKNNRGKASCRFVKPIKRGIDLRTHSSHVRTRLAIGDVGKFPSRHSSHIRARLAIGDVEDLGSNRVQYETTDNVGGG
ncbi:BnaC03g62530D [Brassica napus]|uniref:BnaC03g62530D protein n=1 Tax=Brassica napus TaxID=3708 RepID=A0A078HV96_BRANA|nr:BnaC03g62530D [Brassica napus]